MQNVETFFGNIHEIEGKLYELLTDLYRWEYKWNPVYNTSLSRMQNVIKPDDIARRWMNNCVSRNSNDEEKIVDDLVERLNQAGFDVETLSTEDEMVGIAFTHINSKPMELERFRSVAEDVKQSGLQFRKGYIA